MGLERDRHLLEAQVKDSANRLDDAEQNALKVRLREDFFRFCLSFLHQSLMFGECVFVFSVADSGYGIRCFFDHLDPGWKN